MKDHRDHEKRLEIIGGAIRDLDPCCLVAEGAPPDEFNDQIVRITARIPSVENPTNPAQAISEVFSASFGPASLSVTECSDLAHRIFTNSGNAKLLPPAQLMFSQTDR